jgi:hypothetical protein
VSKLTIGVIGVALGLALGFAASVKREVNAQKSILPTSADFNDLERKLHDVHLNEVYEMLGPPTQITRYISIMHEGRRRLTSSDIHADSSPCLLVRYDNYQISILLADNGHVWNVWPHARRTN